MKYIMYFSEDQVFDSLPECLKGDKGLFVEKWDAIQGRMSDLLHWEYEGEVDLSACKSWRCVAECLWKHKGETWDPAWEDL